MVTIDSLQELINVLYDGTIANLIWRLVFPKYGILIASVCKVHYGETVSRQWLLLTGYRHLQMSCLMSPLPSLQIPSKHGYTEVTFIRIH